MHSLNNRTEIEAKSVIVLVESIHHHHNHSRKESPNEPSDCTFLFGG